MIIMKWREAENIEGVRGKTQAWTGHQNNAPQHFATEQRLAIVLRYHGTMASPSLERRERAANA